MYPLAARDPGPVVTEAGHWVKHSGRLAAQQAGGAVTEAREEQGAVGGVSQPVVITKPLIETAAWTRELILVKCSAAWSVKKIFFMDEIKRSVSGHLSV